MSATLTRPLKLGSYGADVEAVGRALHRYLHTERLDDFQAKPVRVRRTFGVGKRDLTRQAQRKAGLPQDGVVGPALHKALVAYQAYDAHAEALLEQYERDHPPLEKLVEPAQGFSSLHRSLWHLYSEGRRMGLTDLGTYNPRSRLPSGRPSDHAVYPAYAFDLGFSPSTGFEHPVARRFFNLAITRPEVEYVILGSRIWSRAQGTHAYTAGGHANHLHVSGLR